MTMDQNLVLYFIVRCDRKLGERRDWLIGSAFEALQRPVVTFASCFVLPLIACRRIIMKSLLRFDKVNVAQPRSRTVLAVVEASKSGGPHSVGLVDKESRGGHPLHDNLSTNWTSTRPV